MTEHTKPQLPAPTAPRVAVIGGGPAGLMAAEVLAAGGARVDLFDAMPSVGRKFLLAGKGGLNLTHSEALPTFTGRYAERADEVGRWIEAFGPQALREWAAALGITTFVGSSGRVFPEEMKAAPLLRAWLHRLRAAGVRFHMRHRWLPGGLVPVDGVHHLRFESPTGERHAEADAVLLALGGGSWARLGSDGAWLPALQAAGLDCAPLKPSNCGFDIDWSEHLVAKHAGAPLKGVLLDFTDSRGRHFHRKGECVLTATGLEGSLVYAASALLRDEIEAHGTATMRLDLLPERPLAVLTDALARGRGARSLANHLREQAGLHGAKAGLLREGLTSAEWNERARDAAWLAQRIKALPLTLRAARPIDEAISSAGGVRLEALDEALCWPAHPSVACAGEMLDWEAPTGGYLLTACFASGVVAAQGLLAGWTARAG
ncbi:MAG TPA: TIGR03862 family flavoprotein [Ideonella sp.]|uniref:TIGR03862 family flavoprotein n=1 Tax=Ideonella sp. TaxID=1929293 RepID=UPI002E31C5B8|nr:TIGR03862 family flavoprotein [Ideonella sp.]HEX5685470.1 TIGR03862 family flavoprotein [Ideonella sp.]